MTPSLSRNRGVAETIHENAGLAARYGIRSTPEAVVDRVVGAASKARVVKAARPCAS